MPVRPLSSLNVVMAPSAWFKSIIMQFKAPWATALKDLVAPVLGRILGFFEPYSTVFCTLVTFALLVSV